MPDTPTVLLPGDSPVDWEEQVYSDEIMSKGSIALYDNGFRKQLTVPANGAFIHNIAWNAARQIPGIVGGTIDSLRFQAVTTSPMTGITLEVTPAGGVHGIVSQNTTGPIVQAGSYSWRLPQIIIDYLYANLNNVDPLLNHRFFLSIWGKHTRVATIANTPILDIIKSSSPSGNYYLNMLQAATGAGGSGNVFRNAVNHVANIQQLGEWIRNGTFNGKVGTGITAANQIIAEMMHFGARNADPTTVAKGDSHVGYRGYLEDLTESGRSYAEVDAIDLRMYNEAFAVGGRFYGDVAPSNPATVYPPYP